MNNLNSKDEFFEDKKTFDYTTHFRMPKVKINKPRSRRRTAYKGIVNQEPDAIMTDRLQQTAKKRG